MGVVGVIQNTADQYLICRKPKNAVYSRGSGRCRAAASSRASAWKRRSGGDHGRPVSKSFPSAPSIKDGQYPKLYPDGSREDIYMIFLFYVCRAVSNAVAIGEEFETYASVSQDQLADYDLNLETRLTFMHMGAPSPGGGEGYKSPACPKIHFFPRKVTFST